MAFERLPNGALIPELANRLEYAREIHELVQLVAFSGRTKMITLVRGAVATVSLPSEREILDFASLYEGDEPDRISVVVRLPIENAGNTEYHDIRITYSPLQN